MCKTKMPFCVLLLVLGNACSPKFSVSYEPQRVCVEPGLPTVVEFSQAVAPGAKDGPCPHALFNRKDNRLVIFVRPEHVSCVAPVRLHDGSFNYLRIERASKECQRVEDGPVD